MSWYRGIPSVTEEVECGGAVHRIRWRRGSLTALDHDVNAERALVSLGGELPDCVQILDAWREGREDSEALVALIEDLEIPRRSVLLRNIANLEQTVANLKAQIPASHPSVRRLQDAINRARQHLRLVTLPRGLKERFEIEVIVRCERKWGTDELPAAARTAAEALLASRANPPVEESMRSWRRIPSRAIITVETWVIDSNEMPSLVGWFDSGGGFAAASLPLSWLRRVWARGLAFVDGSFILEIDDGEGSYRRVTAARWEHQRTDIGDKFTPVVGGALLSTRRATPALRWLDA